MTVARNQQICVEETPQHNNKQSAVFTKWMKRCSVCGLACHIVSRCVRRALPHQ